MLATRACSSNLAAMVVRWHATNSNSNMNNSSKLSVKMQQQNERVALRQTKQRQRELAVDKTLEKAKKSWYMLLAGAGASVLLVVLYTVLGSRLRGDSESKVYSKACNVCDCGQCVLL
jgi:hypothetical protein